MMNVEEILKMWQKDAVIDEMSLDESSRDSARLHGKYLEMLTISKLQFKRREQEFKTLLRDKWLYYNGKMSKQDMDERGWDYDPFNGMTKPLKGEMDHYYDSDPHIQKAQAQLDYIQTTVDTLKEIMENIKWRHQNIKNMIEWRKFTSGM